MKHKTESLEGELLDAAVALALGTEVTIFHPADQAWGIYPGVWLIRWMPSSSRELGGAIIERERIEVAPSMNMNNQRELRCWRGHAPSTDGYYGQFSGEGPTLLIAAMRALVFSKLGSDIELP